MYVVFMLPNPNLQLIVSTTATGHGPTWIAPPFVTPLKKWIEKLASTFNMTRIPTNRNR